MTSSRCIGHFFRSRLESRLPERLGQTCGGGAVQPCNPLVGRAGMRRNRRAPRAREESMDREEQPTLEEIDRPVASPPSNRVWGSDAIAAVLRELDIPYVALNP